MPASPERGEPRPASPPHAEPRLDPRRYRWTVGILVLVLVLVAGFSISTLTRGPNGTVGVPAGRPVRPFAAPLAASTLDGDANLAPHCEPPRPNPRALNVCGRAPLVLALFAPAVSGCVRQVDVLEALARRIPSGEVTLAAVAVDSGHAATRALVRSHRWTIPVAYDRDGAVGAAYGFEVCPLVELVRRTGIVSERLIGARWLSPAALAERSGRSSGGGG